MSWVGTSFGDANLDDAVDFADFASLSSGFGAATGWAQGDFDGDGQVAFGDFLMLANNFGRANVRTVPEPGVGHVGGSA